MRALALALVFAFSALCPQARADRLLLTLSSSEVTIASNYQGADVTVFGAFADDAGAVRPALDGAVIVTTRGPSGPIAVREKERAFGIWINRETRRFVRAPIFLDVLSTGPIDEVEDADLRLKNRIGLDAAAAAALGGAAPQDAPFLAALRRIQERRGLWRENPLGVERFGPSLFKGTVRLPPNVPLGAFEVEARLVEGGRTLARETVRFRVVKAGFEARVADLAETSRIAYGLVTVALALLFGWLASVIFKRD